RIVEREIWLQSRIQFQPGWSPMLYSKLSEWRRNAQKDSWRFSGGRRVSQRSLCLSRIPRPPVCLPPSAEWNRQSSHLGRNLSQLRQAELWVQATSTRLMTTIEVTRTDMMMIMMEKKKR
ncbi:hypothetical protein FRB91_006137, partial [Serendipita sp. 411]